MYPYSTRTYPHRTNPASPPTVDAYPHAYATRSHVPATAVKLQAQTHAPVVAIDRHWCFATPVTLHIEENPLTRKIRVHRVDAKEPLLEIRRVDSKVGDLFHVFDASTSEHVLTVDGFGFCGRFDVFKGPHEQSMKRTTGPLLVDAACAHVTVYFDDAEAHRPTRAIVDGRWGDRAAVISIHHAVSAQPVARILRPHHLWLKLPYYTLEVAAGVDVLLPLALWLGRYVQFERARVAAFTQETADWGSWSWV